MVFCWSGASGSQRDVGVVNRALPARNRGALGVGVPDLGERAGPLGPASRGQGRGLGAFGLLGEQLTVAAVARQLGLDADGLGPVAA